MNARQVKKQLKKRISKLEQEKLTMQFVISSSKVMSELYERYTEPSKVVSVPTNLRQIRIQKRVEFPSYLDDVFISQSMASYISDEMTDIVKNNMSIFVTEGPNGKKAFADFSFWINENRRPKDESF